MTTFEKIQTDPESVRSLIKALELEPQEESGIVDFLCAQMKHSRMADSKWIERVMVLEQAWNRRLVD